MSSSSQPPRPRYRFGFKGKRPSRTPKATKTNEIPDSLTRYAKLMEEDGKDRILGLQAVLGVESDEMHFQPSNLEATRMFKPFKTKNLGVFAFGAMFIGGLTFLWIYSRLSESLNLQTLQHCSKRYRGSDSQIGRKSYSSRFLHSPLHFLPVAHDEEYNHVSSQGFKLRP